MLYTVLSTGMEDRPVPIADRDAVAPGVTLEALYKGTLYRMEVVADPGGARQYKLADGSIYRTPSAAASSITHTAQNGWRFWSLQGELTDPATAPPKQMRPRSTSVIRQTTVHTLRKLGVTETTPIGLVAWWCSACMNSFDTPAHKHPTHCPEGHGDESYSELEYDFNGSDWWLEKQGLLRKAS